MHAACAQELRTALEPTPLAGEDTLKRLFEVSSPLALQSALTEARTLAGCDTDVWPSDVGHAYLLNKCGIVQTCQCNNTKRSSHLRMQRGPALSCLLAGKLRPLPTLHVALRRRAHNTDAGDIWQHGDTVNAKRTGADAASPAACPADVPLLRFIILGLAHLFFITGLWCVAGPEAESGVHQRDDGGHAARARLPASRQARGCGLGPVAVGAHSGSAREAGKVARVI